MASPKSRQYWLANHPNGGMNSKTAGAWDLSEAQLQTRVEKLQELSATTVSVAELNALDASALVGDAVLLTSTAATEGGSHEIDVTYQFPAWMING